MFLFLLLNITQDHLHWSTRLRLTWNLHRARCLSAQGLLYTVCVYFYIYLYFVLCIYLYVGFCCSLPNKQQHNRTNNTRPTEWMSEITNKQAGKRLGLCVYAIAVCVCERVWVCVCLSAYMYMNICVYLHCVKPQKRPMCKKKNKKKNGSTSKNKKIATAMAFVCVRALVFMMMFSIQLFAHLKYKPSCVYNTFIHCARLLARLSTDVLRWSKEQHKQSYMCQVLCFGLVYVRSVDVF